MNCEELLAVFRDLGGVADNVRLGESPFGKGLFAVDSTKPATLRAPENLLVLADEVEIRGGQLVVKSQTALGERERALFNDYQKHFGWGAGLFEALWRSQEEWSELPGAVIDSIKHAGGLHEGDRRFLPPSTDVCLSRFLRTRAFWYRDASYLAPVVDLLNHSSSASSFEVDEGIGTRGIVDGEIFVRYNLSDPWSLMMSYGFSDRGMLAHSRGITVDISARHRVEIRRDVTKAVVQAGIRLPETEIDGDTVRLSYLTLGDSGAPDLPRAIFRKITSPIVGVTQADKAFDSITHFNRAKFLDLLRTLRDYEGPLIGLLEDAAISQLDALSHCVGVRSL